MMRILLASVCVAASFLCGLTVEARAPDPADAVRLTRLPDRVQVHVHEKLFTEYVFTGAKRPYFYPVLMEDGTQLVRDFPMKDTPGEDRDHPWHRGLWFAHAEVNRVDFWNEGTGDNARSPKEKGSVLHDGLIETTSGDVGMIRVRNQWVAPDGKLVCTDQTDIRIAALPGGGRTIDFEVTLQPLAGQALLLGDNKDGTMAIRLAQWLTPPHKYQKKDTGGSARIVTSAGARDAAAWGTRADWCDYSAERAGKIYGVAIFDHPQNLRHPTWWMARDYGLFAANPFGQHDFEKREDTPNMGDFIVEAGDRLTLKYRFVFHEGDAEKAKLAELYREFATNAAR